MEKYLEVHLTWIISGQGYFNLHYKHPQKYITPLHQPIAIYTHVTWENTVYWLVLLLTKCYHIFTRSYCKGYQITHTEIQWHKRNWFIMKSKTCTMMNFSVFRDEKTMKVVYPTRHGPNKYVIKHNYHHLTSEKIECFYQLDTNWKEKRTWRGQLCVFQENWDQSVKI